MAMYYYASKISAIACGTRCKRTVLQKSRGQRDRDKCSGAIGIGGCVGGGGTAQNAFCASYDVVGDAGVGAGVDDVCAMLAASDGVRLRRRHSDQMDGSSASANGGGLDMDFQSLEISTAKSTKTTTFTGYGVGNANLDSEIVQYDVPKNSFKRSHSDVNYENSVLGSGGIMYINGRIVSGPLESLIEVLVPKSLIDLDKEFIFSFLLSSRLFLRPHELLGKLLSSVPDSGESLESLVALLAEWIQKFPYDYRDERMMSHVKHIVASCSNTRLEGFVSEILSALLKRLTDLERHEEDLRACQTQTDKPVSSNLDCPTALQNAQILCRLEKKLAKQIGPEEFLQCSSNVLLDKQKKWDQPSTSGGPPGAQDPKKTCNLETYLDWSARLRLFVCNEILQCSGIRDRSRTVELWSGVAQYCLLVGNYNSATAILETLESPPIARLKITWSKLTVTCQQLDCMQRHAEGHGDLWQKQATVLNENHYQQQQQQQQQLQQQKTDTLMMMPVTSTAVVMVSLSNSSSMGTTATNSDSMMLLTTTTTTTTPTPTPSSTTSMTSLGIGANALAATAAAKLATIELETATTAAAAATTSTLLPATSIKSPTAKTAAAVTSGVTMLIDIGNVKKITTTCTSPTRIKSSTSSATASSSSSSSTSSASSTTSSTALAVALAASSTTATAAATKTSNNSTTTTKPNDWVVIPVFADIVKLALAGREDCLQRLPNGHINVGAFDRMAAIVGAFTKHMNTVKAAAEAPPGEYEMYCRHMQLTTKLNESELMMASFDCEEPNNAEKLMYDLN